MKLCTATTLRWIGTFVHVSIKIYMYDLGRNLRQDILKTGSTRHIACGFLNRTLGSVH